MKKFFHYTLDRPDLKSEVAKRAAIEEAYKIALAKSAEQYEGSLNRRHAADSLARVERDAALAQLRVERKALATKLRREFIEDARRGIGYLNEFGLRGAEVIERWGVIRFWSDEQFLSADEVENLFGKLCEIVRFAQELGQVFCVPSLEHKDVDDEDDEYEDDDEDDEYEDDDEDDPVGDD